MRIDTSEPALVSLFEKGQVGLIRTEFMRKDDVIANTNELLEIYKRENADLVSENEKLKKAHEWQPIKTAPKDGTHILTCGDGYIVVAMWFVYHGGRSQWETVDGESEIDPTHWMPLPAAPAV